MFSWITSISNIFGYVLNFIYDLVGNYGIAIILFTLAAKVILMPLTYFQQKSTKKNALISEEVKALQTKYKGNEKKLHEETMKLYKDRNTSPLAGCSSCLTVIIQMVLILSIFYLVNEPLTYMKKIDPQVYKQYEIRMYEEVIVEKEKLETEKKKEVKQDNKEEAQKQKEKKEEVKKEEIKEEKPEEKEDTRTEEQKEQDKIKELRTKSGILRPQMEMINRFRDENEAFDINTKFLGLDLAQIPTNSLKTIDIKDFKTYGALVNLIIPVLYIGISIANIIYTNKQMKSMTQKEDKNVIEVKAEKVVEENKEDKNLKEQDNKENKEDKLSAEDIGGAMKDANKSMLYFMPVIMFVVTMGAPLSLALYWLTNTLLSFGEKAIIDKIIKTQEEKDEKKENKDNTIKAKSKKIEK